MMNFEDNFDIYELESYFISQNDLIGLEDFGYDTYTSHIQRTNFKMYWIQ
ncbi:hypothetical protein [Borrelia hispanica]|nr:hypothetical protein [Borrelia hispanica]